MFVSQPYNAFKRLKINNCETKHCDEVDLKVSVRK